MARVTALTPDPFYVIDNSVPPPGEYWRYVAQWEALQVGDLRLTRTYDPSKTYVVRTTLRKRSAEIGKTPREVCDGHLRHKSVSYARKETGKDCVFVPGLSDFVRVYAVSPRFAYEGEWAVDTGCQLRVYREIPCSGTTWGCFGRKLLSECATGAVDGSVSLAELADLRMHDPLRNLQGSTESAADAFVVWASLVNTPAFRAATIRRTSDTDS